MNGVRTKYHSQIHWYVETLILIKVLDMDRTMLLKKECKIENKKSDLSDIYNPYNPIFRIELKKYEGILTLTWKQSLKPQHIEVMYAKDVNLKRNFSIRAKLTQHSGENYANHVTGTTAKPVGTGIQTWLWPNRSNISLPIRCQFNWQSNNVMYVMTCYIYNTSSM